MDPVSRELCPGRVIQKDGEGLEPAFRKIDVLPKIVETDESGQKSARSRVVIDSRQLVFRHILLSACRGEPGKHRIAETESEAASRPGSEYDRPRSLRVRDAS